MRRFLLCTAAAAAIMLPAAALAAQPAFTTTDLNLRAGPGTDYPVVDMIPGGARLRIEGCIAGYNWCSVVWRGEYGWAQGDYLAALYRGSRVVVVDEGPEIGLPIIGFDIGTYWRRHYRHRGFYARIDNYQHGHYANRASRVNGRNANIGVNGRNAVGVSGRNATVGTAAPNAPSATYDRRDRHHWNRAATRNAAPQPGVTSPAVRSAPTANVKSSPFRPRETTGAAPSGNVAPHIAAPAPAAPKAPPAPAAAPHPAPAPAVHAGPGGEHHH